MWQDLGLKSDTTPTWSLAEILPFKHWPEQAVLGWTVDQWSTRELAHLLSAGWARVHTPIVSIWSFTWSNFCWSAQDEWPALTKQKSRLACHRSKRSMWTCSHTNASWLSRYNLHDSWLLSSTAKTWLLTNPF